MKSASINKLAFYIQMLKARYGAGEYFIEMKINLSLQFYMKKRVGVQAKMHRMELNII